MDAESAVIAAGKALEKEELSAELEKEMMLQRLNKNKSGFDDGPSPIGEYLLKQQIAKNSGDPLAASASATSADEAELRHMMELKRKFLSQAQETEEGAEPSAKRPAR